MNEMQWRPSAPGRLDDPGASGRDVDPLDMAIARERTEGESAHRSADALAGPMVVETRVSLGEGDRREGLDERGGSPRGGEPYAEFEWPDGFVPDEAALAEFRPIARKLGLPREAAQELASLYARLEQRRNADQAKFVADNNGKWLREICHHPEFGGPELARSEENVGSLVNRFGSPLLVAQMRQMNIQNWPEMFYFLARISRAVGEDASSPSAGGSGGGLTTAQLLFPGTN